MQSEIETTKQFDSLAQKVEISSSTGNSDRLSIDIITEYMEASEQIKEKIIFCKTKLSSKVKRINSDSIQADTVSQNIQVIDSNGLNV
ncbi:hypothetical protein TNCV_1551 [Trichonephila clavipes]|nr:hypothetical protein TNCV_1551 [Trichonephila clavipes]